MLAVDLQFVDGAFSTTEKQSGGDVGDECVVSLRSRKMRSMDAPLMAAWFCALMRLLFRLCPFASTTRNGKRIPPMSAACGSLRMELDAWWLTRRCWWRCVNAARANPTVISGFGVEMWRFGCTGADDVSTLRVATLGA